MKRLILTIVLTLVIAGFTTNVQTAHAAITFAGGSFVNCTSSNFFGTSTGTTVTVTLSTSGVIGSASGPVSGGNFNITVTYAPQPAGTAISVTITDDAAGSDVLFGIGPPGLSCNSGGNVTFFNPGD